MYINVYMYTASIGLKTMWFIAMYVYISVANDHGSEIVWIVWAVISSPLKGACTYYEWTGNGIPRQTRTHFN